MPVVVGSRQRNLGRRQCPNCGSWGGVRATSNRCARCDHRAEKKARGPKTAAKRAA